MCLCTEGVAVGECSFSPHTGGAEVTTCLVSVVFRCVTAGCLCWRMARVRNVGLRMGLFCFASVHLCVCVCVGVSSIRNSFNPTIILATYGGGVGVGGNGW